MCEVYRGKSLMIFRLVEDHILAKEEKVEKGNILIKRLPDAIDMPDAISEIKKRVGKYSEDIKGRSLMVTINTEFCRQWILNQAVYETC